MKNIFKKTLAIALAATLALGAAPLAGLLGIGLPSITANAAEEEPVWESITDIIVVENNTITGIKEGATVPANIEIPSKAENGAAIIAIGEFAFSGYPSIKAVKIPETMKTIGYKAFADNEIEKVYFNSNICKLENDINFWRDTTPFVNNSNLTYFEFGENVTDIPENACCNITNLQTVVFNAEEIKSIGNYAFYNCVSLEKINITGVKTLGEEAFYNCTSLKSIDGSDANGKIVFPETLKTIGACAFQLCTSFKEVTIPENVETVDVLAFADNEIEKVYFNASECTTEIGINPIMNPNPPFENNEKLTCIEFGKNVTDIPENICCNLGNLEKVIVNSNVLYSIGTRAFAKCNSLEEIYLKAYSKDKFVFNTVKINNYNDVVTKEIFTFGLENKTETNDEFGVTATFETSCYDVAVDLYVEGNINEREKGSIAISDRERREHIGYFDIKMVYEGTTNAAPQPNGTVNVKIAIPQDYIGKKNYKIVHYFLEGGYETFSTSPQKGEEELIISDDGKYWVFNVKKFSRFEAFAFEPIEISIRNNPGSTTISYGRPLRLTAIVSDNLPAEAQIFWYIGEEKIGEGTTCIVNVKSGTVEVAVKIVDENGEIYENSNLSDSQKITVKSGFFEKLIAFFRNLFGLNEPIEQVFIEK